MKKRTSGALAIGVVVVVVAALLAIFNQSRTFAQAMGQDYDLDRSRRSRQTFSMWQMTPSPAG